MKIEIGLLVLNRKRSVLVCHYQFRDISTVVNKSMVRVRIENLVESYWPEI